MNQNITFIEPEAEDEEAPPAERVIPDYGTIEWIQYCSELDGHLPTPIDICITGSIQDYYIPELKWYNYDVYPHKIKMTNTGYTGNTYLTYIVHALYLYLDLFLFLKVELSKNLGTLIIIIDDKVSKY